MLNRLKNLFKIARLLSTDDSGNLRFGRITCLGKEQKILLFTPYGVMSHPPAGSMVAVLNQLGQESNGVGAADDPKNRIFKNLAEGEIAIGNYVTGAYVIFKSDDSIEINAPGDIKITAAGDMALEATNVEITSSTLTHNGTNVGDTHIHSQGNDSAGDSEVDTGGPHS